MDISKFKLSDWITIAGGIVFLVAGLLPWFSDADTTTSAFGYPVTGIVPWVIVLIISILTVLAAAGIFTVPSSLPTSLVFLVGAALSALLVLIRILVGSSYSGDRVGVERGPALYVALVAAVVVTGGAFLHHRATAASQSAAH